MSNLTTISTKLYCAIQERQIIHMSVSPISASDLDNHFARIPQLALSIEPAVIDIATVTSEIMLWDGGDGLYPHLHFDCPKCEQGNNVDLHSSDPNPRFACCSSCVWQSPLWIEWSEKQLIGLKQAKATSSDGEGETIYFKQDA